MSETMPDPASEPATRAEWVDQKLREGILSGEFLPGQRLQAADLGRMWSMSPTPLREAFQRLAVEGLLELIPQRGARVARISLQDAYEVHELRAVLEPLALHSSMEHSDQEWIVELDRSLNSLIVELRQGTPDRGAVEEAHRNYHRMLLARCSSSWMTRILDLLNNHVIRYWTLTAAPRRDIEAVIAEHERIHSFVTAGKIAVATAELGAHLQHALHSVAERVAESEEQFGE
jgi:DNA-binding GntR family transcriptional regulator